MADIKLIQCKNQQKTSSDGGNIVPYNEIGVRDFKYVGKICPQCIGHEIRRMRSGCRRIVNGILREMSELITQERIAVGFSNLVEGLTT